MYHATAVSEAGIVCRRRQWGQPVKKTRTWQAAMPTFVSSAIGYSRYYGFFHSQLFAGKYSISCILDSRSVHFQLHRIHFTASIYTYPKSSTIPQLGCRKGTQQTAMSRTSFVKGSRFACRALQNSTVTRTAFRSLPAIAHSALHLASATRRGFSLSAPFHKGIMPDTETPGKEQSTTPTPPSYGAVELSESEYHDLADVYLDGVLTQFEALQDSRDDIDIEFSVRYFHAARGGKPAQRSANKVSRPES